MSAQDKFQMTESPCIAVCQLDDDEHYCIGCYRTPDEIEAWEQLSETEKKQVMAELAERRKQCEAF